MSLDSWENLHSVKKLVSTIEISRSRSRLLDFVSTTMSRPKSLDRDREIRRDLKFLAFLDSLSLSRPRSASIFVFSCRDFSIRRDFRPRQCRDLSTNLEISRQILRFLDKSRLRLDKSRLRLDKSRQSRRVSTISTKISTRQSLDWKISTEKKKVNLDNLKKLVSTRRTFSISISIGLDCRDPQA